MRDLLVLPPSPVIGAARSRRPQPGRPTEPDVGPDPADPTAAPPHRLHLAARRLAGRLAVLVDQLDAAGPLDPARSAGSAPADFLRWLAAGTGPDPVDGSVLDLPPRSGPDPIDRAVARLGLDPLDVDLLVLAGLPDEHEGLAAVCRALHPDSRPEATTGVAGALADLGLLAGPPRLGGEPAPIDRELVRHRLTGGPLARHGLVRVDGMARFWEADLRPGPGIWPALRDGDVGVPGWRPLALPDAPWGLEDWFDDDRTRAAAEAVARLESVVVLVVADRSRAGAARLAALARSCGHEVLAVQAGAAADPSAWERAALQAVLAGRVPLVEASDHDVDLSGLDPRGPLLVSLVGAGSSSVRAWPTPVLRLELTLLDASQRARAVAGALPELSTPQADPSRTGPMHAGPVVGPATVQPADLAEVALDLRTAAALRRRVGRGAADGVSLDELVRALDHHPAHQSPPGAVLIHPRAGWDDLVLADEPRAQLVEAAQRLAQAPRVIDDWGFLAGRAGGRGLRLLFCGPPGTGKTLAAEVLAATLGRDLLVVDLSRLVSKWVGETEKNLAATFEAAERSGAALLFDEADALFGRRTEVGDARDRYANLETAYLLARIERFDGLVVLATNLRQNLDAAFARRLEFIVTFDLPDPERRARLWRRHLPPGAPLGPDVDLADLAARYPLSGGLIRNAAVAAAFLAATDATPITGEHLIHAVRREFAKAGQNFPGPPPRPGRRPPTAPSTAPSTASSSAKEWPCPHLRP